MVAVPATSMFSLIVQGTPCRGPSSSPAATALSASSAAALASSAKTRVYATNYNVLRVMSGMGGLAYSN